MKKIYLALFLLFFATNAYSQEIDSLDITTPFKLWLLNNEAKAMAELGRDDMLIIKSSTPFSILSGVSFVPKRAEEQLWEVHRNIYSFLNEVQKIYDLAKHFGNGKFAITIKKARPEIWGYSPLAFIGFSLPKAIFNETRKAYLNSLFIVIGLDTTRDKDLSNRLKMAIKSLKDEEYRLAKDYISTFKALYPSERTIVRLEQFLDQGTSKPFATGLTEIIDSVKYLATNRESNSSNETSLDELDSLTESAAEEQSKPVSKMEAPDPNASNIYDIW